MALVNGPLFSLDASGQIGHAIVYAKWKGRNYVREYVTGSNPNTLPQRSPRTLIAAITKQMAGTVWANQGSYYQNIAHGKKISVQDAFISYNIRQLLAGGPYDVIPGQTPDESTVGGTQFNLSVDGSKINIGWQYDNDDGQIGIIFFTIGPQDVSESKSLNKAASYAFLNGTNPQAGVAQILNVPPGAYRLNMVVACNGTELSEWYGFDDVTVT